MARNIRITGRAMGGRVATAMRLDREPGCDPDTVISLGLAVALVMRGNLNRSIRNFGKAA